MTELEKYQKISLKNNRGKNIKNVSISNEGFIMEIIKFNRYNDIDILFSDGTIVTKKEYGNFIKGNVKNPNKKSVFNVGYFGVGKYKSKHPSYKMWVKMLRRCYDPMSIKRNPTYENCTVDLKWHNFQNFAEWWENNYKNAYMKNWELDKDIIIKNNKIYSENNCQFVPREINTLLLKSNTRRGNLPIGVSFLNNKYQANISKYGKLIYLGLFKTKEEAFENYKKEKEIYIKEIAEKWKNLINADVYKSLINYKVEIDD